MLKFTLEVLLLYAVGNFRGNSSMENKAPEGARPARVSLWVSAL